MSVRVRVSVRTRARELKGEHALKQEQVRKAWRALI